MVELVHLRGCNHWRSARASRTPRELTAWQTTVCCTGGVMPTILTSQIEKVQDAYPAACHLLPNLHMYDTSGLSGNGITCNTSLIWCPDSMLRRDCLLVYVQCLSLYGLMLRRT